MTSAGSSRSSARKSTTHIGYLKTNQVPNDYLGQITHNLWITGAQWCDFVSFDDRMPAGLQFLRIRVPRSEAVIREYEITALKFLAEVADEAAALMAMRAA
jgi:hypothetical protein